MPIRLDGSTGITVGTAVTVGTSDIKVGNVVNLNQTSLSGITTAGITTAYVTNINDGPISGFRNKIINGNFDFWQRGTSSSSVGYQTTDRFRYSDNGTSITITQSQQTFTVGQTDVPGEPTYFYRVAKTVAGNSGTFTAIEQGIEDVRTFAGQTATISFYAKTTSGTVSCSVYLAQYFGSGGSSNVNTSSTAITLTTTWQKFTATVSVPSISGKTIGSGNAVFFTLLLPNNSTFTVDLSQVQVEGGTVATPFERRSYGQELALCQRYYEKSFNLSTAPAQAVGTGAGCFQAVQVVGQAAAQYCGSVSFKVTKRTAPSLVTLYNPISANAQFYNANTGGSTSSTASSDASEAGFHLNTVTQSGAGAAGNGLFIHWTATAEL